MAIEVTPPSPAATVPTKSTNSQDGRMFSLRIVNLEYYLSPPLPGMDVCYSKFQGRTVTEVPVVRIYGSTPAGQKACLHLHQVFPYFYVPYDDDLPQDISDALAYVRSLASAIEKAMKLASSNAAKKQHVHSCSLVRARRYYGYYPSEQLFIKIVLYHPQEVARISTLLLGGGIMNRKFQPHESHISYLLQLLIDQNLAGMSYIHLSSVKFRRPIPERPSDTMHVIQQLKAEFTPTAQSSTATPAPCSMETPPPSAEFRSHAWVESSIPGHWVWPLNSSTNGPFGRHSTCELEVDATVEEILNRQELVFVPLHEAGSAIKLVQSLTPMWEEERLRTGEQGPAGAAAALRPSPDRFLPPPSALEQALRDSLFQIVQDEERFETKSKEELQKSTQEMLLECSQAANVVRSEAEPRLDTKSIGVQEWPQDGSSGRSQRSEEELVNEQIIRSQLTPQGLASQEAEDEVAELLEWMGASQEHDMGASDDDEEEALEIRQTWDSPTMEAAMLQALSKFEQATQKECQEILDCVNNEDDDDGEEDLEAALLEIDLEDMARGRRGTEGYIPQVDGASDRYVQRVPLDTIQKQPRIPQNDGADDDETKPDPKRMRVGSKKDVPKRPVWGLLPLVGASSQPTKVKQEKKELRVSKPEAARPLNLRPRKEANRQPSTTEEKVKESEVSLRALMRRKRERRRKESSVSGGSSIVGSQSEGEQSFGVVKSESSLPEESGSQEQQNVALSGLLKLAKEDVDEMGTNPGRRLPFDAEPVARSSEQHVGTLEPGTVYGEFSPKVEDSAVQWDYNVHDTGDHRDCGGGSSVDLIGEDLLMTQPKAAINAGVIENKVELDSIELAEMASLSWAEVVKDITSAKVTLHAPSGFKDTVDLLPSEALSEDEHGTRVIETQLVEHEILWRLKQDEVASATEAAGEDEFIGTMLVQDFKMEIAPHEEIKDSPDEEIKDSFHEDIKDSPHEEINVSSEEIKDSPPKFGNSDAASDKEGLQTRLLFTDMSDASEDSFDWGDEFGSSHRLDDSDEGACASEDDMPDVSFGAKPEQSNGIAPALDSEHALSEAHLNIVKATDGASEEGLKEMFSSKSSSQAKLDVRTSNLSSGTDYDEHNLLRPTDQNEDESEAALHNAISGKSVECSGQELITVPVKFYQKPPSRDALVATLGQHNLREVDYGGVFYGNAKDVPGRATVSAGLIFDVKSREPLDLPPFLFGAENKKSRFSIKAKASDLTPGMGIPCHYENDGSVSYLLTPARPPPSRQAVQKWLSENLVPEKQSYSSARGERVFTMDANTGKLVPIDEAGSNKTTQEEEDVEYFRPASPKYDEKHVLASPMLSNPPASPAYARSTKRSNRRSSGVDGTPSFKSPLLSSEATTSSDVVSKSKLLQASSQDEKNVDCTPPQLPKEGEVKVEVPTEKPKDIPKSAASRWRDVSQITAPSPLKGQLTPLSQSGFRDPASVGAGQQITLMSIEVHSETRGNLRPDPRYDAVGMVVVDIQYDDETRGHLNNQSLVLLVDAKAASSSKNVDGVTGCSIIYLTDELLLLKCFVRLVRLCDPDMLVGWEVQGSSLGLLAERAANLGLGLLKELSRTPPKPQNQSSKTDDPEEEGHPKVQELRNSVFGDMVPLETESVITDEWGRTNGSGLFVGGRIVLNLWRIMRGEVKLGIYTLEAVAEAVLRRRVPRIPWRTLTRWFSRGLRYRCIEYFVERAKLNFEIMDQLDLLNRTAELARVFGIDFYSVFSRGSQYRVESMMLRLAHTQNFLLLSPSRQQVAAQPAMECLPLVMEPESRFYTSPVVVLDFQSLYPSMIIAYNLCFSTCLGKIVSNNPKVLGVTNLPILPGLLQELKNLLTITPNGVMFTPPEVRQGVVPRLLSEILSTRIMVKQAMKKLTPDQRVLQRVLNARQFALKLIANVTYGYTAAGFSGRMPCAELADSIVQCGRLTLERAIHLVNTTKRWDARVVYGDTDSMFVHLEGRTREEAFRIGQDIAASVTAMNPNPVTLKMEKVYHPCVLLTKKRYVGYSYESPGQATPTFDAKGIETIRRDSCAAVAKTLERSLRTLFETQDLSQVKAYLQRQWGKIISGRVSLRDFVFAKEVRLGTYSARASVLPAAAIVASKAMSLDPRAEPRYGERVPYVVVHGEPGARLSDVVVDPHTMLANNLRLHDTYYITKQIIPALQRVLGLVGADLRQWHAELPRVYRPPTAKRPGKKSSFDAGKGATIDHYYLSQHCSVCGELMRGSQVVCASCSAHPQAVVSVLTTQTAKLEMEFKHLEAICRHCGGGDGRPEGHIACVSLDCPIFFERLKVHKELQALSTVSASCGYYPTCFLDFGSELF